MRRSHIRGNEIRVKQEKTDARLWIQIHRDLRTILDEMPKTSLFLLTNSRGTAWTQDGFRASWQSEVNSRPFRVLRKRRKVFHELRKSAVVFLLEAGCSDVEVSSTTGQSRQMVEHYAKSVNQRRLARAAILKWESDTERT